MKKPIENRIVFRNILFVAVIIFILMVTAIGISACDKKDYNINAYTIEFDKNNAIFTIPKDANLSVDKKIKNYVYEQVAPKRQKDIGDMVQYIFENNFAQTFRIEKQNHITRAGYFAQSGVFEVKLNNNENIGQTKEYGSHLPNGFVGVDDIMVTNVGNNYFEILELGETFELKAFRNTTIIDSATNNIQIEPNFNAEILSGESVSVDKLTENSFKIKAKSQGVTKVRLSYQAIEVLNRGKLFCYNASDKKREAELTFAVGECYTNDGTDIFVKANDSNFDSEFDTIYFDGNEAKFEIESNADYIVVNEKTIESSNNKFAFNVKEGANYCELKKGEKSRFMTIYGKKINVLIGSNKDIAVGDKVKIKVEGVYTALPKLSGIYNPTQEFNEGVTKTVGSKMKFVFPNEEEVFAKYQSQYYSGANCAVEFVVKTEHLLDGKLSFKLEFCYEWWGADLGTHRSITGEGVENNLNAKLWKRNLGFFILN